MPAVDNWIQLYFAHGFSNKEVLVASCLGSAYYEYKTFMKWAFTEENNKLIWMSFCESGTKTLLSNEADLHVSDF